MIHKYNSLFMLFRSPHNQTVLKYDNTYPPDIGPAGLILSNKEKLAITFGKE